MVDTDLADNKILKESIHYIWMAAINIDSVMGIDKKNLTLSLPTSKQKHKCTHKNCLFVKAVDLSTIC